MLNLTFLNVDGQRLAASLAFISAGQLYLYNSASLPSTDTSPPD